MIHLLPILKYFCENGLYYKDKKQAGFLFKVKIKQADTRHPCHIETIKFLYYVTTDKHCMKIKYIFLFFVSSKCEGY